MGSAVATNLNRDGQDITRERLSSFSKKKLRKLFECMGRMLVFLSTDVELSGLAWLMQGCPGATGPTSTGYVTALIALAIVYSI